MFLPCNKTMLCEGDLFPAHKRAQIPSRLSPARKLSIIFSVSISAVFAAVLTTFIKTSLFLLSQQAPAFEVHEQRHHVKALAPNVDIYVFSQRQDSVTNHKSHSNVGMEEYYSEEGKVEHDYAANKLVLVLDFWERMINVQSGLRRLVQIGVDSGFTVVEPFVYESKVSTTFSFPEHFEERNMTPQTAGLYFRTEDLFVTNRYISHAQFRNKTQISVNQQQQSRRESKGLRFKRKKPEYLIQAAVFIDWTGAKPSENRPFRWCDEKLKQEMPQKTRYGYRLGPGMHVQRALCLSSSVTVAPARFSASLFQEMFAVVKKGTKRYRQRCRSCVTLAFMNYRKHAFSGFVSHTGAMPFRQKTPPLEVGAAPQRLSERVRTEMLRGQPYVAVQMRTGKAFALLEHYEQRVRAEGIVVKRHEAFKGWLRECTKAVVLMAQTVRRGLGRGAVFYVASDMYNDGWKGGEKCPEEVQEALREARRRLEKGLGRVYWFRPERFGVRQDAMGIAGLADAAVCLKADRFLFAVPSNFGKWVHEQRVLRHVGEGSVMVDCMDPRFVGV